MQDDVIYREALSQFRELLEAAQRTDLREPTAMTLATADRDGRPSVRTMLLKGVDERGFVFFTNSISRKGDELQDNPRAALCFFWQPLMRQVRIEGRVKQVGAAGSDEYWTTRSRDSQLGAWASNQSQILDTHQTLEQRVSEFHDRFLDQPVPRPSHWLGYRVIPERIEFWRSGWHRLHERILYERQGDSWKRCLLYP
ncbi:MAG: pyridoxamine 5'-phosphate oxidase [Pseudomonadota bacterium]